MKNTKQTIIKNWWCAAIATAALPIVAGNAWGFGIEVDAGDRSGASSLNSVEHDSGDEGRSENSSGDHWPDNFASELPGRFGGGRPDDNFGLADDRGKDSLWNSVEHDFGHKGRAGHKGRPGFSDRFSDGMMDDDSDSAGGFDGDSDFDGGFDGDPDFDGDFDDDSDFDGDSDFDKPTAPVPLPASVLFLWSGLIGLAGFVRRSRKVSAHG